MVVNGMINYPHFLQESCFLFLNVRRWSALIVLMMKAKQRTTSSSFPLLHLMDGLVRTIHPMPTTSSTCLQTSLCSTGSESKCYWHFAFPLWNAILYMLLHVSTVTVGREYPCGFSVDSRSAFSVLQGNNLRGWLRCIFHSSPSIM